MKRLVLATLLALAPAAFADGPAHPGPQPTPPIAPADRGDVHQKLDERRAVRGCAVGEDCARAADRMKEIDVELFGRGGSHDDDPWVEGTEAQPVIPPTPAPGVKPSQLHPELPWLDQLELPDLPIRWDERLIKY